MECDQDLSSLVIYRRYESQQNGEVEEYRWKKDKIELGSVVVVVDIVVVVDHGFERRKRVG